MTIVFCLVLFCFFFKFLSQWTHGNSLQFQLSGIGVYRAPPSNKKQNYSQRIFVRIRLCVHCGLSRTRAELKNDVLSPGWATRPSNEHYGACHKPDLNNNGLTWTTRGIVSFRWYLIPFKNTTPSPTPKPHMYTVTMCMVDEDLLLFNAIEDNTYIRSTLCVGLGVGEGAMLIYSKLTFYHLNNKVIYLISCYCILWVMG